MDADFNRLMLKRLTSLMAENKELKEKNNKLIESYNTLLNELSDKTGTKKSDNKRFKRFDTVTILYIDIQGFPGIKDSDINFTGRLDDLDFMMIQFNKIVKKYHLVKLHSIGDNFVCAGGLPEKNNINPITVTLAALEMLHIITSMKGNDTWSIQIGIHTGSVVARLGGKTQSKYEVTGATLNIASRIGSAGLKNKIVVSATTYELIKELYDCNFINSIPVKYQEKIDLYVVEGIKDSFAADKERFLPNNAFRTKLMSVQFFDLQEVILDKLEKELPANLYYHNVKHTVDVVTESELIGWAEGLDDYQILLLKTSALFHDTGHTVSYTYHEEKSTEIARQILPHYHYSSKEIDEICRIILSTKLPPQPSDILEEIICDSDLDYLGRVDFIPVSNSLYEELKAYNKIKDFNTWNKLQLKFIGSHQYFTKTARKLREVKKQEQIEHIKKLITC